MDYIQFCKLNNLRKGICIFFFFFKKILAKSHSFYYILILRKLIHHIILLDVILREYKKKYDTISAIFIFEISIQI